MVMFHLPNQSLIGLNQAAWTKMMTPGYSPLESEAAATNTLFKNQQELEKENISS
jgi:hypothetical protein